jgi:hypothetical protein
MMASLNGDWKLVYTSNSELLAILALSRLPFVTVGDITQRVDAASSTVENKVGCGGGGGGAALRARAAAPLAPHRGCTPGAALCDPTQNRHAHPTRAPPAPLQNQVQLSVPLSRTAVSTTASFEVRSPKRLAIRFERGAIATPELLSDISVPDSVSVLGQTIDVSPLRGLLQPVGDGLSGLISTVGGLLSRQPDLSFPLPGAGGGERASTWLLTTYLDEDTRITR